MTTMKEALIKGIPTGLVLSMAVVLIHALITGGELIETIKSGYSIALIICIVAAWVAFFYSEAKKKVAKQS